MGSKRSDSFKIKPASGSLLILLFILLSIRAMPQNPDNYLSYKKGNVYDMRMNNLDHSQLKYFMMDHPDALSYLKKAKTFQIAGTAIGGSGILCLLFTVVLGNEMTSSGDYNDYSYNLFWSSFALGSSLVAAGLIVNTGYRRNVKTAVNLYNSAINRNRSARGYEIRVGVMSGRMGITVRF